MSCARQRNRAGAGGFQRPGFSKISGIKVGLTTMTDIKRTTTLSSDDAIVKLRQAVHPKTVNFYSMYSSVLGGIVTDPALMVLPLDDHMVHRGHAVFDTATLTHGMLYQLDPHLDRLLHSAKLARIPLPFPRE